MFINWEQPFEYTVDLPAPLGDISLEAPTYGNYGGAEYANGRFTTDDSVPVLDYDPATAKDALDLQFLLHDELTGVVELIQIVRPDLEGVLQSRVDKSLVESLVALTPAQLDAEASVYAGGATLLGIASLELNPDGVDLTDTERAAAIADGFENIQRGYADLSDEEQQLADAWLQDTAQALLPVIGDILI